MVCNNTVARVQPRDDRILFYIMKKSINREICLGLDVLGSIEEKRKKRNNI